MLWSYTSNYKNKIKESKNKINGFNVLRKLSK